MSRVPQTALQRWEDDSGTCNTCPGELDSAESCFQRDPPPPYPWRALGAGLAVVFAAVIGASVFAFVSPAPVAVAAK